MPRGYPDWEGNKSGLYPKPEWAAFEGRDKNFYAVRNNAGINLSVSTAYTVPAGKTLFITSLSFMAAAAATADRDNNQMCMGWIYDFTLLTTLWSQGGNGGGSTPFNKPFVFTTGTRVIFQCTNHANHNCNLTIAANGYEI